MNHDNGGGGGGGGGVMQSAKWIMTTGGGGGGGWGVMQSVKWIMTMGGWQSLFKQSWSQGGHDSSEDIKDAEFDLSRGIKTIEF